MNSRLREMIAEANAKSGAKVKAPRAPRKDSGIPTEEAEQIAVADWLRLHRIRFHHSPNGGIRDFKMDPKTGKQYSVTAIKMRRMGTSNGFPDLMILDAPPLLPTAPGVMVEMKRTKGGVVSDEQKEWHEYLRSRGWKVMVARGADEAIRFLESYGYGRRP